jgi:hypothetical protein
MQSLQAFVPAEWQGSFNLLSAPIAWIPKWHTAMINFAWYGDSTLEIVLKRGVILLPMLLVIVGVWVTMVSLYTIPFRSNRGRFATAMLTSWWDAGRTAWFFWAGLVRLAFVIVGWIWGLTRLVGRLVVAAVKAGFQSPLRLLDWTSRNYFKPGVPWLAFLALMLWSAVEALIFMYTLQPTLTEVLAGITGFEPDPRVVAPLLWVFLYFLVLGSFACVHALATAIREKDVAAIVQMSFVELFVMFFEVVFLYRELIDAITPWVAQTTNEQLRLGLVSTLALASFGWVGVRGMTWFLFGRYGTPALVAVLARETISQNTVAGQVSPAAQPGFWKAPVAALKAETEWFQREARKLFEMLSLPVLQLAAAAVNFPVVALGSRPLFALPFRSLDEVLVKTPRIGFARRPMPSAGPQPATDSGGA